MIQSHTPINYDELPPNATRLDAPLKVSLILSNIHLANNDRRRNATDEKKRTSGPTRKSSKLAQPQHGTGANALVNFGFVLELCGTNLHISNLNFLAEYFQFATPLNTKTRDVVRTETCTYIYKVPALIVQNVQLLYC